MRALVSRATIVVALIISTMSTGGPAVAACASGNARSDLMRQPGAVVATLVEHHAVPKSLTRGDLLLDTVWRFRIDRAIKGRFPRVLDVLGNSLRSEDSLGLDPGRQTGLFFFRSHGRWATGGCLRIDPQALVAAARPLPPADGRGALTHIAGGSFGNARVLALDRVGRTLAYGFGPGRTIRVSVCPGSRVAVEMTLGAWPDNPDWSVGIGVRSLATFELVRDFPVRELETPDLPAKYLEPRAFTCLDRAGADVLINASDPNRDAVLVLRVRDGRASTLRKGHERLAAPTPAPGPAVSVRSLPGADVSAIVSVPPPVPALRPKPRPFGPLASGSIYEVAPSSVTARPRLPLYVAGAGLLLAVVAVIAGRRAWSYHAG